MPSKQSSTTCSQSAAMPLYLIAVGGIIKILLAALTHYKERSMDEQLYWDESDRKKHLFDEWRERGDVNNESRGIETSEQLTFSRWEKFKFRMMDIIPTVYLVYGLVAIPAQAVLDIYHVASSGTPQGWVRYQCYAEILLNSPNLGNIAMQVLLAMVKNDKGTDEEGEFDFPFGKSTTWTGRWLFFSRLVVSTLLILVYLPPLLTHFVPFVFVIYVWATLLLLMGISLCLTMLRIPMQKIFSKDNDEFFTGRFIGYVFFGGLMLVVLSPLAGSTMTQWYSQPRSYIGAMLDALTERTTKRYLAEEIHSASQWFSYFHFFL
eukprot:gb/GECG01016619.1/.p1 GENE.gb/GECG01016619.1/~~gb/GECG01016619.1/.p1  ORF type:complete len:320 (+),score=25.44 gb/GECG01016619.1/:1-960(+)